ncbi:hypothetical protein CFAM422_011279 [Trichoderma lentiforme]|uniref:Uncharacterized protein n=1 Tax=Trichoderma lentiforme TaxID=1567552 RepID=A0A9P4X748_9HYPO|nr:hypothetical protein CFAM422_011279 [Trichoderma lentiforme]
MGDKQVAITLTHGILRLCFSTQTSTVHPISKLVPPVRYHILHLEMSTRTQPQNVYDKYDKTH